MKILCFDIGCTDIKYGIIEDGNIILKKKVATEVDLGVDSFKKKLQVIVDCLAEPNGIKLVGVSCAGSVDINESKIIVCPDHAPMLDKFDFREFFGQFGLECYADNDVNCFGLAEMMAGHGQKYDHFLTMTVGTGIGGAVIMQKNVWRGPNFNAGEFGRMIMQNGVSYETVAATSALVRSAKENGLDVDNGQDVFALYDAKNPIAKKIVKNFYCYLAIGVANLVYAFNPQSVIIGGGISNRPQFADELKVELKKILHHSFYDTVVVQNSYFKNDGGIMGAYYLALSKHMEEK